MSSKLKCIGLWQYWSIIGNSTLWGNSHKWDPFKSKQKFIKLQKKQLKECEQEKDIRKDADKRYYCFSDTAEYR